MLASDGSDASGSSAPVVKVTPLKVTGGIPG